MVPTKFTVPSGVNVWPVDTWGIKLGVVVRGFRNGEYPVTDDMRQVRLVHVVIRLV